jgi:hypothetical protein
MNEETPALTASANGLGGVSLVDVSVTAAMIDLPCIELVKCLIIHVRRPRLCDVETIVDGLRRLPKMFNFVSNEVFSACLDTSTLNAPNGVREKLAGEVRIRAEALPIAATFRRLVTRLLAA